MNVKADAEEACRLFNAFIAAEAKMIKYAEDNATWCGIPPQVIQQIKEGHAQGDRRSRRQVCQAAADRARDRTRAGRA